VLLARLQRHAQRGAAVGVARDADDAPRELPLELVARGEEGRVRAAVAERHAEPLRVAHRDVRAPVARWREEREAEQVAGGDDERAGRVGLLAERAVVVRRRRRWPGTARARRSARAEREGAVVAHHHGEPARLGARAHHVDRLRVAARGDEEGALARAAARAVRERHRLRRRGALVEQRGVGDLEPVRSTTIVW
jgi:hypothetical protein